MYSPELQSQIALWRVRCAEGTMTVEDYKVAIAALRAGRVSALQAQMAGAKKPHAPKAEKVPKEPKPPRAKKAAAPKLDGDDLLKDLEES